MGGRVDKPDSGGEGTYWTVQQFATIAGKPWYALQQREGDHAIQQFTGNRDEINRLCGKFRITPRALEPVTEEEFFSRWGGR
jgi:hypothetical protein